MIQICFTCTQKKKILNLMSSFLSDQNSLTLPWTESHELGPSRTGVYVRVWVCAYTTHAHAHFDQHPGLYTRGQDSFLPFCFCFRTKLSPCVIVLWSIRNCWQATLWGLWLVDVNLICAWHCELAHAGIDLDACAGHYRNACLIQSRDSTADLQY